MRGMHFLARELGMTVAQMLDTMTPAEYFSWIAFYREEAQEQERARRRGQGQISTSDPNAAQALIAAATGGKSKGVKTMKGPGHHG